MAAAAGGVRRALAALRSGSPFTISATLSRQAAARSPELAAASLPRASRRRLAISRVPVAALAGVQGSLMPMHNATASALLTSMLGLKPGSWGWLSEVVVEIVKNNNRSMNYTPEAFEDLLHPYNRKGVSGTKSLFFRLCTRGFQ